MKTFSYIIGATVELQLGLIMWIRKIEEYLNLYYQGDKEKTKNTTFFNCMAKVEALDEVLISRRDDFRGVKDTQTV
jgi:hypothetical protein